ncbi:MAG: cytochrome c oxidase subunit 3 [Acidimicrobiia bacterium]|nr:cytochrome c oxidase subunit 3 [Acidimicrobiia bacterium]MCY4432556.1 cytochrome c oxidase subunit 3 [bacterium]
MADIPVGTPLAAPQARQRTLLVGTVFGTAAALMYFAALFGVYLRERSDALADGGSWIPSGTNIQLAQPTVAAWTLLMSVVTMQWAVYSIARDDRGHAILATTLTTLFGFSVVITTSFQYTQMGLVADDSIAAVLIYTISASHLAMIAIGLVFLLLMAFRALGGQYSSRQTDGFVAASIFWYAVVFVYVVIWTAIFVLK